MPYIICVNVPGCLPEADPVAVATLEDARYAARDAIETSAQCSDGDETDAIYETALSDLNGQWAWIFEEGATIGPLPDGYVIDVRPVSWAELASIAGFHGPPQYDNEREDLINAYNEQGT